MFSTDGRELISSDGDKFIKSGVWLNGKTMNEGHHAESSHIAKPLQEPYERTANRVVSPLRD